MIVFDLKCDNNHKFEAWFQSSSAYEEQCEMGIVECPFCGSASVSKAIMAPNVGAKSNQKPSHVSTAPADAQPPATVITQDDNASGDVVVNRSEIAMPQELLDAAQEIAQKVKKHVEENCDYVGKEFAEEARKIHYGETKERGIYGEASIDETAELIDEGIDILPLPTAPKTDA
jgi:hypothetical protein